MIFNNSMIEKILRIMILIRSQKDIVELLTKDKVFN